MRVAALALSLLPLGAPLPACVAILGAPSRLAAALLQLLLRWPGVCPERSLEACTHTIELQSLSSATAAAATGSPCKRILLLEDPMRALLAEYTASARDTPFIEHFSVEDGTPAVQQGRQLDLLLELLSATARESLLILNGQSMQRAPHDYVSAIAAFLVLSPSADPLVEGAIDELGRPCVPTLESASGEPPCVDLSAPDADVSCAAYNLFRSRFEYWNAGLSKLVNRALDRPPMEPPFLDTTTTYTHCQQLSLEHFNGSFEGPPEVMVLGVQKGGTTSLHELLVQHDLTGGRKEFHLFDNAFNDKRFNELVSELNRAKEVGRPTIESTPNYFSEHALQNMVRLYSPQHLRSKRFIVVLREPVARDFSWYEHMHRTCAEHFRRGAGPLWIHDQCGFANLTRGEAFRDSFRAFHARTPVVIGNYLERLRIWLAVIPRSSLFVINMETLIRNDTDSIRRIYEFIGVRNSRNAKHLPKRNNKESHCGRRCGTGDFLLECRDRDALQNAYARANDGLYEYINGHADRPPSEPHFPHFQQMKECVNITSP